MKKTNILIILIISIYSLTNCHCKHCNDNLSAENQKIPYSDRTLVAFENDTLGIVYDSVFVKLGYQTHCNCHPQKTSQKLQRVFVFLRTCSE